MRKSTLFEVNDLHPGVWFKDVFGSLNEPEKVTWLELFTLAYASEPSGRVNYVSEGQIAALFSIDEGVFTSVIKKARDLGKIEVIEKAIVPCSVLHEKAVPQGKLAEHEQSSNTGPEKTKLWARYKSMIFPGFFEYRKESTADENLSAINSQAVEWSNDKHPLDREVVDPYQLLTYRIKKAWDGELQSDHTGESPLRKPPLVDLPKATSCYDDVSAELDIRLLENLVTGLTLWNESHEELMKMIMSNWRDLKDWLLYYVIRDGSIVESVGNAIFIRSRA